MQMPMVLTDESFLIHGTMIRVLNARMAYTFSLLKRRQKTIRLVAFERHPTSDAVS